MHRRGAEATPLGSSAEDEREEIVNDLLAQLNKLIAEAERNEADANNWRTLLGLIGECGYGPRISPRQIVDLLPNVLMLAEVAASTQEVAAREATKSGMARRKITDDDRVRIDQLLGQGRDPAQIADELGLARSAVKSYAAGTYLGNE
jgi:hypothetical protein